MADKTYNALMAQSGFSNNPWEDLLNLVQSNNQQHIVSQQAQSENQRKKLEWNMKQEKWIEEKQKNRETRLANATDALDDLVKNTINHSGFVSTGSVVTATKNAAAQSNDPAAIINAEATGLAYEANRNDHYRYVSAIDNGADIINRIDTYSDADWKNPNKMTVNHIMNELRAVDEFESALYTDPIKKDAEVKYIGHYSSGDKTDRSIIGRMAEYKKSLNAALMALTDEEPSGKRMIEDHELFYVITGNAKGLENAREEQTGIAESNIKSYTRSINAIEKYIKMVGQKVISGQINGGDTVPFDMANMIAPYATQAQADNPAFAEMMPQDIASELAASYMDYTIDEILELWNQEKNDLDFMRSKELERYTRWSLTGAQYSFQSDLKKKKTKEELQRKLEEQLQKNQMMQNVPTFLGGK
jgi:hypothetical protein